MTHALVERRQEGVGVELLALARRADEAVADPAGEPRGGRPGGRDVDRDRLVGPVVDRGVVRLVELALEGDELLLEQPVDQGDRFPQAREPLLLVRPVDPDRDLVQRLAGPDAQDDPTRREAAERRERLGDDRRVVAEGRRQDARAEGRPARSPARPRRARRARWARGRRCGATAGSGRWSRPSRSPAPSAATASSSSRVAGTARPRPCSRIALATLLEPDARRAVAVEHVDRVDEADLLGLVGHHQRVGPRAAAEEADALEQVAGGDAGRGEDEVLAGRQVLGAVDARPRRRGPSARPRSRSSSLR